VVGEDQSGIKQPRLGAWVAPTASSYVFCKAAGSGPGGRVKGHRAAEGAADPMIIVASEDRWY
jgi:hypothetical protein